MPNVTMPDGQVVIMPDNPTADQLTRLKAVQVASTKGPWDTALDVVKNVGTAAYKGVAGLAAGAADAFGQQPDAASLAAAGGDVSKVPASNNGSPVSDALESTGYQPKTTGEKVLNSLVRGGTGAMLAPGSAFRNAVTGVGAAGGGELAKQYFPDSTAAQYFPDSTAAQLIATVLGGMAGHGVGAVVSIPVKNARQIVADAMPGTTTADLQAAKQRMIDAAAGPTPINLNVGQALDKPNGFDAVVQELANSKNGQKTTATLRAQPGQVAAAAPAAVEKLPGVVTNAGDAANQVQGAAGQIMQGLRKERTGAASPLYEAQQAADLQALKDNATLSSTKQGVADALATRDSAAQAGGKLTALANQQAETGYYLNRHSGGTGEAGTPPPVVAGAAEGAGEAQGIARAAAAKAKGLQDAADALAASPPIASQAAVRAKVQDFVKQIDQKMQIAGPAEAKILQDFKDQLAPNGQPLQFPSQLESVHKANSVPLTATSTPEAVTQAGVLGPYTKQLNALVQDVSPLIAQGRGVYKDFTDNVITPMKQSVTGDLAGLKGVPVDRQVAAGKLASVFNKGTNPTSTDSQIMKLGTDLRGTEGGAEAFNNAAVTHLSDKIQGAIDGTLPTTETAGNIHSALYGTTAKAQGTKEILVNMARNQGLPDNALYPTFEKVMGYISSAAKSGTASGLNSGEIQATAGAAHGAQILTPFYSGRHAIGDFFSDGAYKRIDGMLNTPEGVDKLIKLAKQINGVTGPEVNSAIATFLAGTAEGTGKPDQTKSK